MKGVRFESALCVILTLNMTCGRVQAQEVEPISEDRGPKVRQYVRPLLDHPYFPKLDWTRPVAWKQDQFAYVHLPNELAVHSQGIFRVRNVKSTIWNTGPLEASCHGEVETRVLLSHQSVFTESESRERALSFLKRAFPWFFELGPLPVPAVSGPDWRNGIYSFKWQRFRPDEFPSAWVYASIRAIDGKIVDFGGLKVTANFPHRLTPAEAKQKALVLARKDYITDIEVIDWSVDISGEYNFYAIQLKGRDKKRKGGLYYGSISIDSMTGQSLSIGGIRWEPERLRRDPMLVVEDRKPVWSSEGLIFVSDRALDGMPAWAEYPGQLLLQDQNGIARYLTADLEAAPFYISGLPNGTALAINRAGFLYGLDLLTGNYKELTIPHRSEFYPAVDSAGRWSVSYGKGFDENATTSDLFADDLQRKTLRPVYRGRLVATGDQQYPIFSPDGRWLYYVTNITTKDKKTKVETSRTTLDRIARETVETTRAIVLKGPSEPPPNPFKLAEKEFETIVEGLPENINKIYRMSFFPDSQRLLMQTREGMSVISVTDKTVTPVTLPQLVDTELDSTAISQIKDGWAGPTDDRVTFSGLTVDKAGQKRWRIYSCRLDGTDVKAHTSKDNVPVEGYVFPATKKPAIEVAKEWALGELAWEDTQMGRGKLGN